MMFEKSYCSKNLMNCVVMQIGDRGKCNFFFEIVHSCICCTFPRDPFRMITRDNTKNGTK